MDTSQMVANANPNFNHQFMLATHWYIYKEELGQRLWYMQVQSA